MSTPKTTFNIKSIQMVKSLYEKMSDETAVDHKANIVCESKILKSKKEIEITIKVDIDPTDEKGLPVVKIESLFLGKFTFLSEPDYYVDAENFCKGNGPAIVYPYIRHAIANQCALAGLPVISLPVVNFFKIPIQVEIIE